MRKELAVDRGSTSSVSIDTANVFVSDSKQSFDHTTSAKNKRIVPKKVVKPAPHIQNQKMEQDALDVDTNNIKFDPNAKELRLTWSSSAKTICCLNTYPNGITFSIHDNTEHEEEKEDAEFGRFLPNQFHLRFKDTRDYLAPEGKYFVYREDYIQSLEHHLSQLHREGKLSTAVVYLGTTSDPFLNLHKKFDLTMNCLALLEQYRPGLLVVQTRSPLVITALPTLKLLGSKAVVAMNVESHIESSILRYTPGQPRIAERLVATDGLRAQGITVNFVVSPVLPYGDFYRDAWDFAELLTRRADYVTFGSLATEDVSFETELKSLPISKKLIADNNLRWLRPHSFKYVYYAASTMAPEKLLLPVKVQDQPNQLQLFAA